MKFILSEVEGFESQPTYPPNKGLIDQHVFLQRMRIPKRINAAGFKTIEITNKTTTSSLDSLLGNSTLHT
jgi:hypothetical protein